MNLDDYEHLNLLLDIEEKVRHMPHLLAIKNHINDELKLIAEEFADFAKATTQPKAVPAEPKASPPIYPAGSGPQETNTDRRI